MQEDIYDIVVNKDDITWQSLIMDLVNSEQMNPWDVDISLLAKSYINVLRQLQESNFFVSGKMLLAAAMLLKIKSDRLVNQDISNFDSILYPPAEEDAMDIEDVLDAPDPERPNPRLTIKTPMPRKRKVSLNDLMNALKKALDVNQRKILRRERENYVPDMKIPENKVDISNLIKSLYDRIIGYFQTSKDRLVFTTLIPSGRKEDKIYTFIPLLHLANDEKVHLEQKEHFGEIYINNYNKEDSNG